mmetsp:Transcript_41769/g.100594  ORF Transcript_41769/g.100594 Transcript_41769/m.100594 type:complete len:81 (-) Transcript_41769:2379-2621(-)
MSNMLSTSFVNDGHNKAVPGTIAYQAPELLSKEVVGASRVSEMYSFGVTVWECLTGKVPHRGKWKLTLVFWRSLKKRNRC